MSSRPRFPPEIWGLTLHNLRERKGQDDLQYLWTEVRHVSKQFREEIEEIFRIEHLPKTWLHFDTGELIRFLFGCTHDLTVPYFHCMPPKQIVTMASFLA